MEDSQHNSGSWDLSRLFNQGESSKKSVRNSTVTAVANLGVYEVQKLDALRIFKPNNQAWSLISTRASLRKRRLLAAGSAQPYLQNGEIVM